MWLTVAMLCILHGFVAVSQISVSVTFNIICRLGKPDHKPNPLLWFYNTGLGGTDGVNSKKWSLKTFPTLLRENNHTDVCIFV